MVFEGKVDQYWSLPRWQSASRLFLLRTSSLITQGRSISSGCCISYRKPRVSCYITDPGIALMTTSEEKRQVSAAGTLIHHPLLSNRILPAATQSHRKTDTGRSGEWEHLPRNAKSCLENNRAPVSLFGVFTRSKEDTGKDQQNNVGGRKRGREKYGKGHSLLGQVGMLSTFCYFPTRRQ